MTPPSPGQLPLVDPTAADLLAQLKALRERALTDVQAHAQLAAAADAQLADAARRAHAAGASWADIGAATGLTRQGARQKWGTP
jgi:hypothetical protein